MHTTNPPIFVPILVSLFVDEDHDEDLRATHTEKASMTTPKNM